MNCMQKTGYKRPRIPHEDVKDLFKQTCSRHNNVTCELIRPNFMCVGITQSQMYIYMYTFKKKTKLKMCNTIIHNYLCVFHRFCLASPPPPPPPNTSNLRYSYCVKRTHVPAALESRWLMQIAHPIYFRIKLTY